MKHKYILNGIDIFLFLIILSLIIVGIAMQNGWFISIIAFSFLLVWAQVVYRRWKLKHIKGL